MNVWIRVEKVMVNKNKAFDLHSGHSVCLSAAVMLCRIFIGLLDSQSMAVVGG